MHKIHPAAVCLGTLLALGVATSVAADPSTAEATVAEAPVEAAPEAPAEAEASRAPAVHGMRAFRDPETGRIRQPTAAERRALGTQLSPQLEVFLDRSSRGLKQERRADGTVLLNLQGRFRSVSIARRGADGTIATDCGLSPEAAARKLAGEALTTDQPAEE